jgi:non-haem Fe2+, alpha-ketoglutarate-dependent halogenase
MDNPMMNPGQLKSFPSLDELPQLKRRLEFHPSTVSDPKILTKAQVEAYNKDGYVKPIDMFGGDEITAVRRFFDDILARTLQSGRNSYSIVSAHVKHGRVYDLLTDPRMVAVVKDILGDDVVGWGAQFFCKMPGDNKIISWHQDASFWPLSPSKTVTAWLAIDDADIENACMRFVGGSHRLGHLTYRFSEDAEQSVLNQTVDQAEQLGPVIYDELKAGQISLHSDLLLHGSNKNNSSRRRCGLTLRYCSSDVTSDPRYNWHKEGVLLSGSDPNQNWWNPARPTHDYDVGAPAVM